MTIKSSVLKTFFLSFCFAAYTTPSYALLEIPPGDWISDSVNITPATGTTAYKVYSEKLHAGNLPTTTSVKLNVTTRTSQPPLFSNSGIDFWIGPISDLGVYFSAFTFTANSNDLYLNLGLTGTPVLCALYGTTTHLYPGTNIIHAQGVENFVSAQCRWTIGESTVNVSEVYINNPVPEPSPIPTPIPSPTPESPHFIIEVFADGTAVPSAKNLSVLPSQYDYPSAHCAKGSGPSNRNFEVKCEKISTNEYSTDCGYEINVSEGDFNGGHDHGKLPNGDVTLNPNDKSKFTYEAPDVAHQVNLTVNGFGPSGERLDPVKFTVDVQAQDSNNWVELSSAFIDVIINGADPKASHSQGFYGSKNMADRLKSFSEALPNYVLAPTSIPRIRSEAASLKWGGMYDIHKDWNPPHCGHRNGRTLDISLSGLSQGQKNAIASAARRSNFEFTVFKESPANPGTNHWHVQLAD